MPQLLYWINVRLSNGSNIWLGCVIIVIAGAQVVLLSRYVEPAIDGSGRPRRSSSWRVCWCSANRAPTSSPEEERDLRIKQDGLAAALRLGLAEDATYTMALRPMLTVSPLLEALGHYPFSDQYDRDCGLIDTAYAPESIAEADSGKVESVRRTTGGDGLRLIAKLPDETPASVDCVVVGNADDRVVGIGTVGLGQQKTYIGLAPGSEDEERLVAVAPLGSSSYRLLLVLDDGSLLQIGPPIDESEIAQQ